MSTPKDVRRAAAAERQEKYDKLSLEQKLELTTRRRGESKKERARLLKLIEASKASASAKAENQLHKLAAKQSKKS